MKVTAMSNVETFWDSCAEKYAQKPIKRMDVYERTMARTRAYLTPTDHVLEIGCGSGSTALLLSQSAAHITASDISGKMIEIGRERADAQSIDNVDFVQGTLADDGLKGGPYDAVLAFNFLHLLEDLPGAMARINAFLKPGGILICKTMCLAEQTRLWRVPLFIMETLWRLPRVNVMKIDELEEIVAGGGFTILEAENHFESPPARFIVGRKL